MWLKSSFRIPAAAAISFCLSGGTSPAVADVIHVPGDYPTIQEAIDAAVNGDEIVVADGVYLGPNNRDLDFNAKLITVRSENGPDNCSINCQFEARAFHFHSGETTEARVEGFTIANGSIGSPGGGAIYCIGSSPSIVNCIFINNRSMFWGGGAVNNDLGSSPVFTDCTFTGNRAEDGSGGAIANGDNCNPTFNNCTFDSNLATDLGRGGAITNGNGSPSFVTCTFVNNVAGEDGGAIYNTGNLTLTDCTITNNTAGLQAGGMYNGNGTVMLNNCTFSGNEVLAMSGERGGGMLNNGTNLTLINCEFTNNFADGGGGGLSAFNCTLTITNCAFGGNSGDEGGAADIQNSTATVTNCSFSANTAENGGGLYVQNSSATVVNSVLWGNSPEQISGTATVTYSCVQGGFAGEGNIDTDPLFVDPDNNDFHLAAGSPAIDAADNTAVPKGIDTDLDGNPRFVDDPDTKDTGFGDPPIVDMGAYEFQASPCPWDLDSNGAVGASDLLLLLANWGNPYGAGDLLALLANWGACP